MVSPFLSQSRYIIPHFENLVKGQFEDLIKSFENGLTIKELKGILEDWPDTNEDGEDYTVWIGDGSGLTNEVKEVCTLSDGDLLLERWRVVNGRQIKKP